MTSAPTLMGIVNVTPDSFSDGGEWFEASDAITHGLELQRDGAESRTLDNPEKPGLA